MNITTIRPGLLVSLHTSVAGNVRYFRKDIEADHLTSEGELRAVWETARIVQDAAEHEAAIKVRSKCRSLITAVCAPSSFGLLCPQSSAEQLADAIREARDLAASFNDTATLTRIAVYVVAGRIAQDDVEAVRAINAEIRELMEQMETGLRGLDVKAVREAADKARALSTMLSPDAASKAQRAIEVARQAARRIVKAGETAAVEVDAQVLRTIQQSRAAFLDFEEAQEMQEPVQAGRAVDLELEEELAAVALPPVLQPSFEME